MYKTFEDIQAAIKEYNIKIIDFKEIDLDGRWHHLSIPAERFTPALIERGIGFDGSSYGFLTVEKSDMVFIPDVTSAFLDTAAAAPMISMIGDIYRITGDGYARFESDPRHIAEKAERFMKDADISDNCLFGPEFEFYILDSVEFRNEVNHIEVHLDSAQAVWNTINSEYDPMGNRGYKIMTHKGYHADIPRDASFGLRNEMVRALEDIGIPVKYHHSENGGPGQVEIEVEFATLKEMADRAQKIKYIVKNLAFRGGKTVTFMPKPFYKEAGSGMHVHMQMFNRGQPVFYGEGGYSNLSDTALHAIGGILAHSASLAAFTCPSTNSYKRLVPGYEAPVTICFGESNRSSVIRIPGYARSPMEKRFEFRPSDATSNPYLCFAALAMAAVDGIQRKTDPTALGFGPFDKNMYALSEEERKSVRSLPKSLDEAADALEADCEFLLNGGVFSGDIIRSQLKKIRKDAGEMNIIPHPLEFQKYFDL